MPDDDDDDRNARRGTASGGELKSWERRLLRLADADEDMSPADVSKLYAEMGKDMRFLRAMRLARESRPARMASHVWAIVLAVFTAAIGVLAGLLTGGGAKHP